MTQLIRRGSMSLGTSTPAAAAPCSRRATSAAFFPRKDREATVSRAARWRKGRAPTTASVGSDPQGGGHGVLRPGHLGHRRQNGGRVPAELVVGGHRRGGAEVDEPGPAVVVDHDGLDRQRPVGDPLGLQGAQLTEDVVEGGPRDRRRVADRRRSPPGRWPMRVSRRGRCRVDTVGVRPFVFGPSQCPRPRAAPVGRRERNRPVGHRRAAGSPTSASWAGPAGPAASTVATRAPARPAIRVR